MRNISTWAADRRRTDTVRIWNLRALPKDTRMPLPLPLGRDGSLGKTFRTHGRRPPGQTATTMYLIPKHPGSLLDHNTGMNLCKRGHASSTTSPRYGHTTCRRSKGRNVGVDRARVGYYNLSDLFGSSGGKGGGSLMLNYLPRTTNRELSYRYLGPVIFLLHHESSLISPPQKAAF